LPQVGMVPRPTTAVRAYVQAGAACLVADHDPGRRGVAMSLDPRQLVFLIGYRGTGKSTVARLLAARFGWDWVDADEVLEERYGKSIRQVFAEEGEAGFRDKEATMLEELCHRKRLVVATGGGVVVREANRARLREGWVVWLMAYPKAIWKRLRQDVTTLGRRPDLGEGGLREIERLVALRTPFYRTCADYSVDTTHQAPDDIAAEIDAVFTGPDDR